LVLVYDTSSNKGGPLAWKIFEHPVLDAVWTADDEFILCGSQGVLEAHRVKTDAASPESGFTADTIASTGLEKQDWLSPLPGKWDKVRYDEAAHVIAVASTEDKKLCMCGYGSSNGETQWTSTDLAGQLSALAFQVRPSLPDGEQHAALLAATFEDGACALYTHRHSSEDATMPSVDHLITVHMSSDSAYALAWTPDGAFLAVGGSDIINIWETSALVHFEPEHKRLEKNANAQLKSLVTWRSDAGATGPRNGEHEPERPTEPSLSWSSDGESLAFAVDRQVSFVTAAFDVRCMRVLTMWQIAVIRFQSPLKDSGNEEASEQVNGVQS
jgi:WD40 repeat protein